MMSEATSPEKQKRLEGRVAQILNERELVITIGSDAGVKPGMKFAVLSETPLNILDPTTGAILDVLDREKVRVEASEVRLRITVCRTFRTFGSAAIVDRSALSTLFGTLGPLKHETLRVTDKSFPPPLAAEESYVKVNDRVVHVPES